MTIDATPGGAAADSFVDVATADAYHADRLHNDEWAAADTATKEAALKWATRELNRKVWKGEKATAAAALRWPRSYVYDLDNVLISNTVIPGFLEQATAELAWLLITDDTTVSNDLSGFESLSLTGVGSMSLKSTPGKPTLDKSVSSLINHYIAGGGFGSINVVRV